MQLHIPHSANTGAQTFPFSHAHLLQVWRSEGADRQQTINVN